MRRIKKPVPEFKKGLYFKDHSFCWVILRVYKHHIILDQGRWVKPDALTKRFETGGCKEVA